MATFAAGTHCMLSLPHYRKVSKPPEIINILCKKKSIWLYQTYQKCSISSAWRKGYSYILKPNWDWLYAFSYLVFHSSIFDNAFLMTIACPVAIPMWALKCFPRFRNKCLFLQVWIYTLFIYCRAIQIFSEISKHSSPAKHSYTGSIQSHPSPYLSLFFFLLLIILTFHVLSQRTFCAPWDKDCLILCSYTVISIMNLLGANW